MIVTQVLDQGPGTALYPQSALTRTRCMYRLQTIAQDLNLLSFKPNFEGFR